MDGTDAPPYAVIDVGADLQSPAVSREMTFDLHMEHIYVLTENRVSSC